MPLYDYKCQQCSSSFTELRKCNEMDTQIDCPECGGRQSERVLSAFAVGGHSSSSSVSAAARSPFS